MISTKRLDILEDERGSLFEMVHSYELPLMMFGQVYLVRNRTRGIIRAFHVHSRLYDYFTIVNGSAKFCFADRDKKTCCSVVVSDRAPSLITVPPGVFHGWMSLEDNTILVSVGSELYDKKNPDEARVSPYCFNDLFGGDPWMIKGR